MPINLFIGGLGAPAAGYVVDMTGSYDPAWWTGVALMLVAAALFVVSNNPGEPQTEQIAESPYNVGRISNSGSHDNQGGTV